MTWNELKAKAKDFASDAKDKAIEIWDEHKTEILVLGPPIIAMIAGATKEMCRSHRISAENNRRALDIYDPQSGCHLFLKKALSNAEKVELDARRRAGQSVTQALGEMGKLDYTYFKF